MLFEAKCSFLFVFFSESFKIVSDIFGFIWKQNSNLGLNNSNYSKEDFNFLIFKNPIIENLSLRIVYTSWILKSKNFSSAIKVIDATRMFNEYKIICICEIRN